MVAQLAVSTDALADALLTLAHHADHEAGALDRIAPGAHLRRDCRSKFGRWTAQHRCDRCAHANVISADQLSEFVCAGGAAEEAR